MLWCSSEIELYCSPIELLLIPILASYLLVVVSVVVVFIVVAESLASCCSLVADLGGSSILYYMCWRSCFAVDNY